MPFMSGCNDTTVVCSIRQHVTLIEHSHTLHVTLRFSILFEQMCKYRISLINTAFLISTPVWYYLNTNNIDIVVIFISSVPLNSTACHFATPGITAKLSCNNNNFINCTPVVTSK